MNIQIYLTRLRIPAGRGASLAEKLNSGLIGTHLTQSTQKVTPFYFQRTKTFQTVIEKSHLAGDDNLRIVKSLQNLTVQQGVPGQKYSKYCPLLTCWSLRTPNVQINDVYLIKSITQAAVIKNFEFLVK